MTFHIQASDQIGKAVQYLVCFFEIMQKHVEDDIWIASTSDMTASFISVNMQWSNAWILFRQMDKVNVS